MIHINTHVTVMSDWLLLPLMYCLCHIVLTLSKSVAHLLNAQLHYHYVIGQKYALLKLSS